MLYHPHKTGTRIREAVYSYRFAEETVESFVETYARVVCFIAEKTGVEPKSLKYALIKLCQYNNKLWNITRDAIKRVEYHDLYGAISPLSVADARKYLTVVKVMVTEDWLDAKKEPYLVD